jgi:hypothetical protein
MGKRLPVESFLYRLHALTLEIVHYRPSLFSDMEKKDRPDGAEGQKKSGKSQKPEG